MWGPSRIRKGGGREGGRGGGAGCGEETDFEEIHTACPECSCGGHHALGRREGGREEREGRRKLKTILRKTTTKT